MKQGTRIRVTNAYPVDGATPGVNYWIRGREGVVLGLSAPLVPDGEPIVSVRIDERLKGAPAGHYLAFLYPSEMEIIA